jgi:hypothetical protein
MSDESGRPGGSIRSRDSLFVAKDTTDRDRRELYEFGPFRLEPAERKLLRGSEVVVLTPKAFETLVLLVRNSGRLLEKDELLRMLWPDSFVEEGSLSNNIFVLRKGLGDDSEYIETVPSAVIASSEPCASRQVWKRRWASGAGLRATCPRIAVRRSRLWPVWLLRMPAGRGAGSRRSQQRH